MERIAISLAGHTNNGKTTLARTLLRKDIGVVDDRPHVTDIADGHVLHGDAEHEILLWDLPGFGDSVRLVKRIRQTGILGWLQTQFDRWADRPLWCGQKCLENVRQQADVVLYLIEAGADPAGSPEIRAELEVLAEIGKPVILLLNQTGIPDPARDNLLARAWLDALADFPIVRDALPLDGWMRCWVQESILLDKLAAVLPEPKRATFQRLVASWKHQHHDEVFAASIRVLARALAETAAQRVVVDSESVIDKATSALSRKPSDQVIRAQSILTESLVDRSREAMRELIRIHQLEGVPGDRVESMIDGLRADNSQLPPGFLAILAGVASALPGGLLADIMAGGMTFGGGAVAAGILGGLAVYALGHGYRKIKGDDGRNRLLWSEDFLIAEWKASAMRYLAIAHYGRGKGQWRDAPDESLPIRWQEEIDHWMRNHKTLITATLGSGDFERIHETLVAMIRSILNALYPGAREAAEPPAAAP